MCHPRSEEQPHEHRHPTTLTGTYAIDLSADTYPVTGHLTIKRTTKPVTVDDEYIGTAVGSQLADRPSRRRWQGWCST
jgi:polyisoprenoid-binding protein YceI